ncbi:alpha/beta hydrolase family protein [Neorhizobium alkalisoli]|uniref:alpha/beta hydrolase family protein n=1 Tax=Neorhizobium alkalisoli TaxID=528178 RepID=UPI000CF9CC9D|nr:alpha/beta fold hydrolase [Neorhizobium alkalisoli]
MADDRVTSSTRFSQGGPTRRALLAATAGLSAATLLPASANAAVFPVPEILPLEKGDYAEARRRFRTNLIKKGPAPEKSEPLGTPSGARRVLYHGGPEGSIELIAWLSHYEPSAKLKPAVLFLHGGNATGDGHWELMKSYWEAGFVVLHPSFRGENGQAGNFSGFYDETADALAAANYLESLPGIDKGRLFLAGHSNGGTLSLLASMTRKFRAAAPISAGVNSWRFFGRYDREIRFDADDPMEFIMRSSVCFGPSLKCPTLLLRGTEERPFDKDHQLLIDRARSAGVSIEAKLLPGNHNGVVPGAVLESIRFFNEVAA